MPSATLSASARRDVSDITAWIDKDSRKATLEFRSLLATLLHQLGDYPETGSARPELAAEPYRFRVMHGFPYVIVYNARRQPPVVMRVLHGSQNLPEILSNLPPP
jgi:toxin ParE1/3/4